MLRSDSLCALSSRILIDDVGDDTDTWSGVTRVRRLTATRDQISGGNWVEKKLRRITIHVTYNKTLTGPINSNYISSMSRMIYILNLSSALSQIKRPNHSQSGWFCVRAFFCKSIFFKGQYLHPKSRNSVSEKTTHGQGDCWCMLFCS